ncbi:MAG TPA: DUF6804 family protein [Verrucomicrobiae bacterium]|nr:DUF6804 family protein [Verrucomicrobiae bacterium]
MSDSKISTMSIWFYVVPAVLLVFAPVYYLQYSYYQVLRLALFADAAYLAHMFWKHFPKKNWTTGFLLIALAFNPFFPLYFSRQTWLLICYGAAAFFIGALVRTQPDYREKLRKALNKLKTGW